MHPSIAAFVDQLVEVETAVSDHIEQPTVIFRAADRNVGGLAAHVLACGHSADDLIQQRTPVTAVDGNRAAPFLSDRIEQSVYQVRQLDSNARRRGIIDVFLPRNVGGGQFGNGKVFHRVIDFSNHWAAVVSRSL